MQSEQTNAQTYEVRGPDGRVVAIPVRVDPATDPYVGLSSPDAVRQYFQREGYVVIRGLVAPEACDAARSAFLEEVKPSRDSFCRHESGRTEPHTFTDHGYMKYPIVNFHDVRSSKYPRFRRHGLDLLTQPGIQSYVQLLLGEAGKLVHTFCAEGNQVTWAHRDSYYIDSHVTGALLGVWIAAEDIDPGAGRLYVYPRSHTLTLPVIDEDHDLDPNDAAFKGFLLDGIRSSGLVCRAPAMRKGDALLFSSMTVHGSLETSRPECSRSSFAGHFIPQSHRFLWSRSQEPKLQVRTINSVPVGFHQDQDYLIHRLKSYMFSRFPTQYALARSLGSRLRAT